MAIQLEFNEIYEPIFFTDARHIHFWGGRARGGSYHFTKYFLHLITEPEYFRGFIMREVKGDIRESLWLDIKDRIEEADLKDYFEINESEMSCVYLPTGNTIVSKGFKKASKKQTAKLKSMAAATHVLVEEMEEVSEEDFKQLDDTLRTVKVKKIQLLGSFNPPPKSHWIWKKWYNLTDIPTEEFNRLYKEKIPKDKPCGYFRAVPKNNPALLSIFSTYHDNVENLNPSFINNLKAYKIDDPDYYYTMVEGLISEGVRGRIYKDWVRINEMPNQWTKVYGLDWGFAGDPLALVETEVHNKTVWVDEKIYLSNLTNDDLEEELERIGVKKGSLVICDSAAPKDIQDMKSKGWNFVKADDKSVVPGIKEVKEYKVYMTERSANLWNEYENYAWAMDQSKNPTGEPIDEHNHGMDALRYRLMRLRQKPGIRVIK